MTDALETPLVGLPRFIDVPKVQFGPLKKARLFAQAYTSAAGIPYTSIKHYLKVDPARAQRIAQAYDDMKDDPQNETVKASYAAMITETLAQYQFVKLAELKIEMIPEGRDPYAASPRLAILDVVCNNHMWVFPTAFGFGQDKGALGNDALASVNPLLALTDEWAGNVQLCVNDVFRIVHDYFGHIKEGIGFRADGEENAWRSHSTMYSRRALGAITTELRGQNSWLNYGPYGDMNRTAKAENTIYAEQKIGLLPEWVWDEGRADPSVSIGPSAPPSPGMPPSPRPGQHSLESPIGDQETPRL